MVFPNPPTQGTHYYIVQDLMSEAIRVLYILGRYNAHSAPGSASLSRIRVTWGYIFIYIVALSETLNVTNCNTICSA